MLFVVLATLLLLLLLWAVGWRRNARRLPPGPRCLPLLGYLPFLGGDVHLKLSALAARHGPVYRLHLGTQMVVVLSDAAIIRDAFRRDSFSGRPSTEFTQIVSGYGIINTDGELWKEQRRFVHEKLRSFGARNGPQRDDLERRIMVEVRTLLRELSGTGGVPYDLHPLLASCLSNVICSLLMGVRFGHRDPRFLRFLHLMDEGLRLFTLTAPVNFVSGLRFVPGINGAYRRLVANRDEMFVFFRDIVEQHKQTLDAGNVRDFVDAYLVEIERQRDRETTATRRPPKYFSEKQLHQVIADLFSAGLEPVKDTVQWAVLYMITHSDVQTKVQQELDQVVGTTRLPSLQDLPYLPYTEATVMEVQRMANVLAIGTSRATTQNTTLCGYAIPKDTHVLPLLWAVHMDPTRWKEPERFDPGRFLGDDGRVHRPDHFLPFSTGRRMCLGDTLARMEIFLVFASILHQFRLSIPAGEPAPSLEGTVQITRTPGQFRVSAELRQPRLCTEDFYGDA